MKDLVFLRRYHSEATIWVGGRVGGWVWVGGFGWVSGWVGGWLVDVCVVGQSVFVGVCG